jgi:hypothetical protein
VIWVVAPCKLVAVDKRLEEYISSIFILKHSAYIFLSQVSGSISNTGHSVMFTVDNSTRHHINVTGGPLSYKYQFQEIHVHYGIQDDRGSEHSINGYAFPAEVCSNQHTYSIAVIIREYDTTTTFSPSLLLFSGLQGMFPEGKSALLMVFTETVLPLPEYNARKCGQIELGHIFLRVL